jgi:hypothetical protein
MRQRGFFQRLWSQEPAERSEKVREYLYALLLCLILIALLIFTADQAPQWIYQGF